MENTKGLLESGRIYPKGWSAEKRRLVSERNRADFKAGRPLTYPPESIPDNDLSAQEDVARYIGHESYDPYRGSDAYQLRLQEESENLYPTEEEIRSQDYSAGRYDELPLVRE